MKPDNKESSFKEIKGVWRSKDFNTNYPNRLKEEASFNSDLNVFDKKGKYWIRAKYQVGVSYNLYEDYLISCPEVLKEVEIEEEEEVIEEQPEEPKEEEIIIVEEPKIKEPEKKGIFKRVIDYIIQLFS